MPLVIVNERQRSVKRIFFRVRIQKMHIAAAPAKAYTMRRRSI